jgi:general L-amino acid transport system substrate-binding protein
MMTKRLFPLCLLLLVLLLGYPALAQEATPIRPGPTLSGILAKGEVTCGLNQNLPGFGYLDPNTGVVRGMDVDLCRALGAAIFGDASAVNIVPYPDDSGLDDLRSNELDILLRNYAISLSLDGNGLTFGPVTFYNASSFLVETTSGILDWTNLEERTICYVVDSPTQAPLLEALDRREINYEGMPMGNLRDVSGAFFAGQCDTIAADRIELEQIRLGSPDAASYLVWSEPALMFNQSPFAPLIRYADEQWAGIVEWTLLGLLRAEYLGISSENVSSLVRRENETDEAYVSRVGPSVVSFLELNPPWLALPAGFMVPVLREVGNYGELYARYLGETSELPIPRTLNALASDGGLFFVPAWR